MKCCKKPVSRLVVLSSCLYPYVKWGMMWLHSQLFSPLRGSATSLRCIPGGGKCPPQRVPGDLLIMLSTSGSLLSFSIGTSQHLPSSTPAMVQTFKTSHWTPLVIKAQSNQPLSFSQSVVLEKCFFWCNPLCTALSCTLSLFYFHDQGCLPSTAPVILFLPK